MIANFACNFVYVGYFVFRLRCRLVDRRVRVVTHKPGESPREREPGKEALNVSIKSSTHKAIFTASVLSVATAAHAQWTVTNLHPTGLQRSDAGTVDGAQQAGYVQVGGFVNRASLWSGTAASWIDLNPANATESSVSGMSDGRQCGYADIGGVRRAGLWSGTAASWFDLHPQGATHSGASAISGQQQTGVAIVGGVQRASLWTGTAASWVDLHPQSATWSFANAVHGGQQGGNALVGGVRRASLWSGSAASWTDLNPLGSSDSSVTAMSEGQQVGWAFFGSSYRPGLWTGTASSWIDLTPTGASGGFAHGVSNGQQVGYVGGADGVQRASLWSGTAASWVDLSAFLPAGFTSSIASGISSDGVNTYIVGSGFNSISGRYEALLWSQPVPAPGAAMLIGFGGLIAARRRRHEVRLNP